jgi:hypothetical protein
VKSSLVPSFCFLTIVAVTATTAAARQAPRPAPNYDEAKVPAFTLPDPLTLADGTKVADAETWRARRRPELLELFRREVYGRAPEAPRGMTFTVEATEPKAVDGLATRKIVAIRFSDRPDAPVMRLMVYVPNAAKARGVKSPAFLGLNFGGNQAVDPDPAIPLPDTWMRDNAAKGYVKNRATDASRGSEASRWPLAMVLRRGYALATANYHDIDPDFDDGFKNGVHGLLDGPSGSARPGDAWGSIAAWAWGLSRALDYLETDPDIDATRVAVLGHSRLGKTSLWAGASDDRFALVISNDSGEGGAALARRRFGETTRDLNTSFPHWFCGNFKKYSDREETLPVDQHELIALIAPRPVFIASAEDDRWADPKGEFLAALGASPVYRLLGTDGLGATEWPAVGTPVLTTIGYQMRPGPHDVKDADWAAFLDFADKHMKK